MYRHLFFLFFVLNLTLGAKIDLQKLYEDAEAQMEEKVKFRTKNRKNKRRYILYASSVKAQHKE